MPGLAINPHAHCCAGPGSAAKAIPQQYIAMMYETVATSDVDAVARGAADLERANILHKYKNAIKGFAFSLPTAATQQAQDNVLDAMRRRYTNQIESITPDYAVQAIGTSGMQLSAGASNTHTSNQPCTRSWPSCSCMPSGPCNF